MPTLSSRPASPSRQTQIQEDDSISIVGPAPRFLATLSPQKSAASTTTTKGVALGHSSASTLPDQRPSSKGEPSSSSIPQLESSEEGANASETDSDVGHKSLSLSMRLNSAMKSDFPTVKNTGSVIRDEAPMSGSASLSSSAHSIQKPVEATTPPLAEASSSAAAASTKMPPDGQTADQKAAMVPAQPQEAGVTGPATTDKDVSLWSAWTSRAASGSMTLLKQGGNAAVGLGSAFRTNPFRNLSGTFGGEPQAGPSSLPAQAPSAAQSSTQAGDEEEDEAHLVRSAADSLRLGAKNEEKRRQRAQRKDLSADRKTQATKEEVTATEVLSAAQPSSNSAATLPEPSSATTTRSNSPAGLQNNRIRGLNVVDMTAQLPGSDKPPTSIPERQYYVLTQAGKPVFLSHISKRRLAREDAARSRIRAVRGERHALEDELSRKDLSEERKRQMQELLKSSEEHEEQTRQEEVEANDRDEEEGAVQVGVLQALVSNFSDQGPQTLERKSIEILKLPKRHSRVVFLLREPLYLAVTSTWHDGGYLYSDSTATLKAHLEILHAGLISLISESQLHRMFSRGHNFDLRRMLEGTDGILENLVARLQIDFGLSLGAGGGGVCLRPMRMDLKLREDLASCLSLERWASAPISKALAASNESSEVRPGESDSRAGSTALDPRALMREMPSRPKDLLYVLLITSKWQLITLLRPRKLSAYPLDLHLLLNTISGMSRRSSKEVGSINWLPICLPRFAPQGMVQAHVSWLSSSSGSHISRSAAEGTFTGQSPLSKQSKSAADCALVIVTANRESFEEVSTFRDAIVSLLSLSPRPPLQGLSNTNRASLSINPDDLHLPGLRHFVLKKRDDLQLVWSDWVDTYAGDEEEAARSRLRVTRTYERVRELCVLAAKAKRKGGKKGKRSPQNTSAGKPERAEEGQEGGRERASINAAAPKGSSEKDEEDEWLPPAAPDSLRPYDISAGSDGTSSASSLSAHPCYAHYIRTSQEVIYVECPPASAFSSSGGLQRSSRNTAGTRDDSGQGSQVQEEDEALLLSHLPPYEVYLTLSPNVPPHVARRIARAVLRWGFESRRSVPASSSGGGGGGDGRPNESVAGERWRLWLGRGTVF